MPPGPVSRHLSTEGVLDAEGHLRLTMREPYRYTVQADTRLHTVRLGDTLWTLADRYFEGEARAGGLWWAIADFQPTPIVDPTLQLEPGTVVHVPSLRLLRNVILADRGR